MKKENIIVRRLLHYWFVAICSFCVLGCTDNFEKINTDPHGIDDSKVNLGTKLERPLNEVFPSGGNMYQYWRNLHIDIFAGYYMGNNSFGGNNNYNYRLRGDFNHGPFENYFLNVLKYTSDIVPACKEVKLLDYAAMGQITQALGALEVLETYGPMPYRSAKNHDQVLSYDPDKQVYDDLLGELDESVAMLIEHLGTTPTEAHQAEAAKIDKWCMGDAEKWIRVANTIRLRMAIHISKADPSRAKSIAEGAVNNKYGVLTAADSDVQLPGNPIKTMFDWDDCRMNASMESILKGYGDPRLEVWWNKNRGIILDDKGKPAIEANQIIIGIRQGVPIEAKDPSWYSNYSTSTYEYTDSRPILRAAEALLLRAEGDLRGWNMGGKAKDLYNEGVRIAMKSAGITGQQVDEYLNGELAPDGLGLRSADYVNYRDQKYNSTGLNDVSVTWKEDGKEKQLQRIITQKWIALYPNSFEAWTEFRRTGYPKIFPIPAGSNLSNGAIDTDLQIRRLPFTEKEYNTNTEEATKAVGLLNGPDTGGTRLWWDVAGPNI